MAAVNRRTVFAMAAALPAPALLAPAAPAGLLATSAALLAEIVRLDATAHEDSAWVDHWDRRDDYLDAVEALPRTPENAILRARALLMLDFEKAIESDPYTDNRLIAQLINSLVGVWR